jgi:hypothetical protein
MMYSGTLGDTVAQRCYFWGAVVTQFGCSKGHISTTFIEAFYAALRSVAHKPRGRVSEPKEFQGPFFHDGREVLIGERVSQSIDKRCPNSAVIPPRNV